MYQVIIYKGVNWEKDEKSMKIIKKYFQVNNLQEKKLLNFSLRLEMSIVQLKIFIYN